MKTSQKVQYLFTIFRTYEKQYLYKSIEKSNTNADWLIRVGCLWVGLNKLYLQHLTRYIISNHRKGVECFFILVALTAFCILCFQEDGVVVTPVVVLFVVLVTYHTNFGQNFSMF